MAMTSSIEGHALHTTAARADVLELRESYHQLLRAIDCGKLEVMRHLMNRIEAQQSRSPGLSEVAQEAFDRVAIAATTGDVISVREALEAFRNVLRETSSRPPPPSTVHAHATASVSRGGCWPG